MANLILAESLVGAFTKCVGSNRSSRFVVAWFMSLITAATFPSSKLGFFLFIRWQKEAIRLQTKPRSSQARRQGQSLQAKEFSRWLQCNMIRTPLIIAQEKTQTDGKRSGKSRPGIGRPIAFPRFHQKFSSHGTRTVRFGRLLLDAKQDENASLWSNGICWHKRVGLAQEHILSHRDI